MSQAEEPQSPSKGDRPYPLALIAFILGALNAFVGVAVSAFGWHATGADTFVMMAGQYQVWHGLGLVALGLLGGGGKLAALTAFLFQAGILCFSGSLLLLGTTGEVPVSGAAPLGGFLLMAGWLALAWAGWRRLRPVN